MKAGSEHDSDSSDEGEQVAELPQALQGKKGPPRISVSAEVFGAWNKKGEFNAPKYEKAP